MLDCGRKGAWSKNAVYQDGFPGIRFIPFCGCSLQRYVPLDWRKCGVCFDKLRVRNARAPTSCKLAFNLFINITLLNFNWIPLSLINTFMFDNHQVRALKWIV